MENEKYQQLATSSIDTDTASAADLASHTPVSAAAMSFMPVNPRPMLQDLVGKPVSVRLKWGETEYKGALVSIDSYMNLQLSDTEEFIDGESTGQLGQVLIRCNNVLWIRGDERDTKMED